MNHHAADSGKAFLAWFANELVQSLNFNTMVSTAASVLTVVYLTMKIIQAVRHWNDKEP